ncbi:MAG: helix-turn-helix domain-containing protein [Chitinophagaceae bacterium]
MTYTEYKPASQLSHCVEKIWYCRAENMHAVNLTIPLLHHELIFNFCDEYSVQKVNGGDEISLPVAWINGLQSQAYYSYSSGRHEMLGVLFKPYGLKAFLKDPCHLLTDSFLDANLIFGNCFQYLVEEIQETGEVCQKVALVENFLTRRLADTPPPGYLLYSVQQLPNLFGTKGFVNELCKDISISNKSLITSFTKHIGINPVKFSHLQVINNAVQLLSEYPRQSLTSLGYTLKFYDQAHFIRLFKSVTSLTPSEYSAYVINRKTEPGSHNFISVQG